MVEADGCAPDAVTWSMRAAALGCGGQWRRALVAQAEAGARGVQLDAAACNALVDACWASGVAAARLRAVAVWAAANRAGHLRLLHQTAASAMAGSTGSAGAGSSSDSGDVLQHSCAVLTAGAAAVAALRWLADLRRRVARGGRGALRRRTVLLLPRGKAGRVAQPAEAIRAAVAETLVCAGAPVAVAPAADQPTTTRVEADGGALADWLLGSAAAAALLAPIERAAGGGGGSSSSAAVAAASPHQGATLAALAALLRADEALESRCAEAMALVRSFEQLRSYAGAGASGGSSDGLGSASGGGCCGAGAGLGPPLRHAALAAVARWAALAGLAPSAAFDALELVKRCCSGSGSGDSGGGPAAAAAGAVPAGAFGPSATDWPACGGGGQGGSPVTRLHAAAAAAVAADASPLPLAPDAWPAALAACLALAARQAGGLPGGDYGTLSAASGVPAGAIAAEERRLFAACRADVGAVSPLRVAVILLERLGGDDAAAAAEVAAAAALDSGGEWPGGGSSGFSGGGGGGGALLSLARVAWLTPSLDALPPTVVAGAIVAALRRRRGQWPAWPTALEALTGCGGPTDAAFAAALAALEAAAAAALPPPHDGAPVAAAAAAATAVAAAQQGLPSAATAAGGSSTGGSGNGSPSAATLQALLSAGLPAHGATGIGIGIGGSGGLSGWSSSDWSGSAGGLPTPAPRAASFPDLNLLGGGGGGGGGGSASAAAIAAAATARFGAAAPPVVPRTASDNRLLLAGTAGAGSLLPLLHRAPLGASPLAGASPPVAASPTAALLGASPPGAFGAGLQPAALDGALRALHALKLPRGGGGGSGGF